MATKNNISDIAQKVNYLVDVPLIINANIIEYDISKANITMLYSYGMISKEEYEWFLRMDKMTREISIGRRMLDDDNKLSEEGKKINACIKEGIAKAKSMLLEANNVPLESIIRIANDAVYINGGLLPIRDFDINNNGVIVHFKSDKVYNMMLNLRNITIFIMDNPMTDTIDVDVKGINDRLLPKHEPFLEFICNTITDMQRSSKESALYSFNDFYNQYVNLNLPIEYYREFNQDSMYKIKGTAYLMDNVTGVDKSLLDIECNLTILRQLYAIILDL